MTTRFIRFILGHRRLVWGVGLLLLLPCLAASSRLRVNNTITTWFLEDDPHLRTYYAYQKVFGNDEVAIVAVRDERGVFEPATLEQIRGATQRIARQPHVDRVLSIASATAIDGGKGTIAVRPALPETGPIDVAAATEARRLLTADPIWRGQILSADLKTTLVVIQMKSVEDMDAARTEALTDIRQVLAEEFGAHGIPHAMGGIGVIYDALNQITVKEGGLLIGLSYALIITSLTFLLRSWRLMALGLGVVFVTATLTMGLYALSGRSLNMVTVILPSLLLVIVIVDFIHVVMAVYNEGPVPEDPDARERAIEERVGRIAIPCFFTSLTNATGFLALATSPISLVRDLGLFGGIGSIIEWLVTIPMTALVLARMSPVAGFRPTAPGGWLERVLGRITTAVLGHRGVVKTCVIALTLFFAVGLTRVTTDTYTIGYFRESNPVRRDHGFIESHFGYYIPVEMTLKTSQPRGLEDPGTLVKIDLMEQRLLTEPVISKAISIAGFAKRIHQVLDDQGAYGFPATRQAAAQELLLYEMDPDASLEQYATRDRSFARISGRMRMMSVRPGKELMERLEGDLNRLAGSAGQVEFAGYLPLYVKIIDYLVTSQIQSFALAFLFVFGPMYLLFRSLRLTVISIVPNVLPIGMVLGAMGWLGIPLDVATVTIAAIVLGLAVDDTIHFLHGFQSRTQKGLPPEQAVIETIMDVGKAVITTTIVLFLGFSVMGISSVRPVAYFGVLSGLSLIAGLICEFLVTPLLLTAFSLRPRQP